MPIAVLSKRLGHANQNVTLSIYDHAIPADARAATKVWNGAKADVIQCDKKPSTKSLLVNVSRTGTDNLEVIENEDRIMAGTTGLEPAQNHLNPCESVLSD